VPLVTDKKGEVFCYFVRAAIWSVASTVYQTHISCSLFFGSIPLRLAGVIPLHHQAANQPSSVSLEF
jgi:hypothetical protein